MYNRLKKTIQYSVSLVLLVVGHASSAPEQNSIPEAIISSIVHQTLAITNPENGQQPKIVTLRTQQVKKYLNSINGNIWYKNYVDEFAMDQAEVSSNSSFNQTHSFDLSYVSEQQGISEPILGYYYIHRPGTSGDNFIKFNCMADHPIVINPTLTITKSPTLDAFCGLANFNAFNLTKQQKYFTSFLKWADFFVRTEKNGRWEWTVDVDARGIKAPWISGLTQSLGISLLLRAYQATHNEVYLNTAKKALQWLTLPLSEGGVAFQATKGVWYEEYPNIKEPSHVLNGHIWALFGLWDYYRVTGDEMVKKMFFEGITVIKENIEYYDLGYWVVYAGTNRVDTMKGHYMAFVIEQMKVLYAITDDQFFDTYSKKWADYQKNDAYFVHMAVENFLKSEFMPKA